MESYLKSFTDLGFLEKRIIIMECTTTMSFSALVNDNPLSQKEVSDRRFRSPYIILLFAMNTMVDINFYFNASKTGLGIKTAKKWSKHCLSNA